MNTFLLQTLGQTVKIYRQKEPVGGAAGINGLTLNVVPRYFKMCSIRVLALTSQLDHIV